MTHQERQKLMNEMQNKKFLYEVRWNDQTTFGTVIADTDEEAKAYALKFWPGADYVIRDHWGYGSKIALKE